MIATHRLKSAVPAGNLARMGSEMGSGTEEQTSRLGMYFEAIGVAFQIIGAPLFLFLALSLSLFDLAAFSSR